MGAEAEAVAEEEAAREAEAEAARGAEAARVAEAEVAAAEAVIAVAQRQGRQRWTRLRRRQRKLTLRSSVI